MLTGIGDRGRHCQREAHSRHLARRRGFDDRRHIPPLGAHSDTL